MLVEEQITLLKEQSTAFFNNHVDSKTSIDDSALQTFAATLVQEFEARVSALVDTASEVDLISQDLVNLHRLRILPLQQPRSLKGVNDTALGPDTTHFVRIVVIIASHREVHDFMVTPMVTSLILGRPWLRRHDPTLRHVQASMSFDSIYCQTHCLAQGEPITVALKESADGNSKGSLPKSTSKPMSPPTPTPTSTSQGDQIAVALKESTDDCSKESLPLFTPTTTPTPSSSSTSSARLCSSRLPNLRLFPSSKKLRQSWILNGLAVLRIFSTSNTSASQASLLSSGITMAQLARDLEQLPASLVLRRRVKLVVGLEPIMMLKPVPTASIVFRITHIPKQGHPGWGLGQDEKPPCLVTKYPRVDGAHLVDNKYQAYFPEVMWALDDALQTPPASMATYFGVVARGLTETLRDASLADETPIMTSDNDVIPLDRSTHGLFDQHSLLFSPFGDGSWVWLSAAWPMPTSIIAALEAQSDPFEGVKRQLGREITTAPSMLASAIKVVLQAFGTDALKAAYKALAWTLKTRVSPRQPSSSSRRTDPSSSRSQQSAQRSISSSSGPVRDARRSLGGLPTSGSSKRLSALSSSSRRSSRFLQDSMSLPPSDPPGSPQEFWDELEQHQPQEEKPSNTTASSSSSDPSGGTSNGSNWNASSSRGTKDTPDTSAESEGKTLAPITTSAAQEELGQVAESVREGVDEEENLWDPAANFDELWAENDVGRVGTKQQRKAANLLDYFSQLEFEEVEGSESSENGDEDNDGLIGVPLRTYKRAQKLCEDKNNRISASEERALREALTLIKTQGELDELLDDRYKASFYMSFPTLVTRYKFAAVE